MTIPSEGAHFKRRGGKKGCPQDAARFGEEKLKTSAFTKKKKENKRGEKRRDILCR